MSCAIALDTSGRGGAVAIARDGALLGRAEHDPALGYAEELFGLLDAALGDAGIARTEVDAIAVVCGPGSFTGLRIGVMTAKTVARATGWQLLAAPTLDLVAAGYEGPAPSVMALAEAGGGKIWCDHYERGHGDAHESAVQRLAPEEVWSRVAPGCVYAATDADLLAALKQANSRENRDAVVVAPLADTLAMRASLSRWPARIVDPLALVPEYLSPSQAERVHGLDLRDEVHRPIRPTGWG